MSNKIQCYGCGTSLFVEHNFEGKPVCYECLENMQRESIEVQLENGKVIGPNIEINSDVLYSLLKYAVLHNIYDNDTQEHVNVLFESYREYLETNKVDVNKILFELTPKLK